MSIYLPRKARVIYFPKCFLLHCGYPYFCAAEDDQVKQNTKVMEEDPVVYDFDNDMDDVMVSKIQKDFDSCGFVEANPELEEAMVEVMCERSDAYTGGEPLSRTFFGAWETNPLVCKVLLKAGEVFGRKHRDWIRYHALEHHGDSVF